MLCVQRQTSWTEKTTSAIYLYSILFDRDRRWVSGVFGMWLGGNKVHRSLSQSAGSRSGSRPLRPQ